MAVDQKLIDFWRKLIKAAAEGGEEELQSFLFFFTIPKCETNTRLIGADGRRVVEFTYSDVPGEVRREIVDLLTNLPPSKRGRKRGLDPATAGIARHLHELNLQPPDKRASVWASGGLSSEKLNRTKSIQLLAKQFKVAPGTMRDVIDQRKTYAANYEPPKENSRRRKIK